MNVVLQLSAAKISEITSHYLYAKVDRNSPGLAFAAKLPTCSISVYNSGKVMFQGASAEKEAAKWGDVAVSANKSAQPVKTKGDILPAKFENFAVIGSDETGTGDYFGPVTVAAVYVAKEQIELLKELGLKDSKMLTDDFMREIAPLIRQTCTHSVLVCRNDKYNAIQAKGYSQGKIKALLHNKALANVLTKMAPMKPDYILIDQFAERPIYYRHIQNEAVIIEENVLFSTKAEQLHVAVAAASILARDAFLREMDQLSKVAGMTLQKGASGKVDEMAARIWLKNGEQTLKSMAKWHFANTEKARKLLMKKRGN